MFRSLEGDSFVEANEWLEDFYKYMAQTVAPMTGAMRKKTLAHTFEAHVKRGSPAKEWWDSLTPAQQGDWAAIEALFGVRWPPPRERVIDVVERRDEFHAVRLTEAELNTKVAIGRSDRTRWAHVAFAEKLKIAGEKSGLSRALLIADANTQVPQSVAKLMAHHGALDWDAWCDALAALAISQIQAEQAVYDRITDSEKESDILKAAIARLEAQVVAVRSAAPSPSSTRWGTPQTARRATYDQTPTTARAPYASPLSTARTGRQLYTQPATPATPSVAQTSPATRNVNTSAPATPTPRGAREMTPGEFPTPAGASRLFAQETCTRCGQPETAEHNRFSCENRPLSQPEQHALMRARFSPRGRRVGQVAQLEEEYEPGEGDDEHELSMLELQYYDGPSAGNE